MGEQVAGCSSADAQRIREAVAVLSQSKPRKKDVRPLQSFWHVAFQQNTKDRPLGDVRAELETKVIEAAQKLQRELAGSAEQPAPQISPTSAARPGDANQKPVRQASGQQI